VLGRLVGALDDDVETLLAERHEIGDQALELLRGDGHQHDARELARQVRQLAALPAGAVGLDGGRQVGHQTGSVVAENGEDEPGHGGRLEHACAEGRAATE
jgi:hypothetical protein